MKFFLKVLFLVLIYFSSATAEVNFQQKKFYYENLVKSWSTIVELISVWKRLSEFEKKLKSTEDSLVRS